MLSQLLDALTARGFSGSFTGNIEVTSGDIGVGTTSFEKCACLGVNTFGVEYACQDCGRALGNYVWTQSGDGAGSYPVIEIQSASQALVGAFVVFDSYLSSSSTLQEQIASGEILASEPFDLAKLRAFGDLRALNLGTFPVAEEVLIADVLEFHSQSKRTSALGIKGGSVNVIAYSEPMGQTDSARSANDMLTEMPDAPRPRVLAILPSSLSQLDVSGDEYTINNWPSQILAWRTSMITTEIPQVSGSSSGSSSSDESRPAFCTQCGVQFLNVGQKFCQMCGSPAAA